MRRRDRTTTRRCVSVDFLLIRERNLLSSCAKTPCLFFVQVSALQADIKSLKTSITESTRNEQKALADCRTLQEAVKEMSSLESVLKKKDSNIKALEMEVCL